MSGAVNDSADEARLARARALVTRLVEAAWMKQSRLGEGIGEHVRDAVIALVTEQSPRAKVRMVMERAESLNREAERLLDHTVEIVRTVPQGDSSYVRFFEAAIDLIKLVREGEVDLDSVPVEPFDAATRERFVADSLADRLRSANDYDDWARVLRDRGQIEEARAAFVEAVKRARAEGEPAVEGSAEIGLFTLIMNTSHTTPGSHQRLLEHARRAVDAYHRAGDRIGERDAVVAMITVLTDIADQTNLGNALDRLARLDEGFARWWRAYATAMHATRIDEMTSGLRWCVEWAHLLDDHADFYRKMCVGKLAFFEKKAMPEESDDSDLFRSGVIMSDVLANGPSETAARRLDDILRNIEQKRRYARSQTLQRQLSDTYGPAYEAAVLCAEALRGPEQAVDLNELASSRGLLAQAGMHQLWRQWHPQVWEDSRSAVLQDFLGRFITSPTDHHRRLLIRAFGDQREALQRQEDRLLSATPGLTTAAPPTSTSSVRALLAEDDRIVVYSATGLILLVSRDECRTLGRFPTADVDIVVQRALAHLSNAMDHSPDGRAAVAWLATTIIGPVLDHVPDGGRLFLVPHGSLSQIPLGVLGPAKLSRTREVSYVPSLSLLARALTRSRLIRSLERFVGYGDPDGSLPHSRIEIEHAAGTFADSFVTVGEEVEYHMAMANLADADVAHLACHGMFFPDYPDFSALHLSGPAGSPVVLWYGELARYELNARLVVLAACHAGTGVTLFGSEYVGFPGAFLAAGARGVLAPLWAVSDESTKVLMRHFYRSLEHFASPAAALREAQQAMADDPATAHPYHWAGFQLFGAPQTHRLIDAR